MHRPPDGPIPVSWFPDYGEFGTNRYLCNGKEFNDDFDLDWYVYPDFIGNYGARFYDAQIGRWHSVDPLAERFPFQSTFVYAANSPVKFIDYMGMSAEEPEQGETNKAFDWKAAWEEAQKRKHQEFTIYFTNPALDEATTNKDNSAQGFSNPSFFANSALYLTGISSDLGQLFLSSRIRHFDYLNKSRGFTGINFNKELSFLKQGSKTLKNISRNSVLAGGLLDFGIGVPFYYNNKDNPFAVSPTNATINLSVAAYSYYINPAVGILYFGIDLFYPGGWRGAMEMQETLIKENQMILGPGWNMYK